LTILALCAVVAGVLLVFASAQTASPNRTPSVSRDEHEENPAGPVGQVSPTSLDFGQVLVGQTSPQKRVRLANTGDSELTVSSISISGDFALPVNHCANGVKPGTHCDVYVTFTPTVLGTETGTLTFTDNASNSPQTVSLTGVGSNTAPTKTTLTASPTGTYAGQPITFTAAVKSLGGGVIPNGERVAFSWHGALLGYGTLQSGVANFTTSAIYFRGQSTQRIVGQYLGDQIFQPSEDGVDVHITRYNATVTVTSDPNPSLFGQDVTLTGNVTSPSGYPVGGYMFLGGLCGSWKVPAGGSHVCKDMNRTNAGNYQVYADFLGDGYNNPATGFATHVISPTNTSTSVTSSKNPSAQGQPVTFSVVVKAPFVPVEGSVTFTSGSDTLGTVQLVNARGSIITSALPVGQNTITATYNSPNGNYLGSSASLVQVVK
jgi:hypothetical protein